MHHAIKAVTGWRSVLVVVALLSATAFPSQASAVRIGDHHAGGVVFYVDRSGENGLVVAEMDLPGATWVRAIEACRRLVLHGYSDWYLPSTRELKMLCNHRQPCVVDGFRYSGYWSSTESRSGAVFVHNCPDGFFVREALVGGDIRRNFYGVRPVRAFHDGAVPNVSIGDHHAGGIVFYVDKSGEHGLVADGRDFGRMGWDKAIRVCRELEIDGYTDWHLPNKDELNKLYAAKSDVGVFFGNSYWSSLESSAYYVWYQEFTTGVQRTGSKDYAHSVRLVRAF